MYSITPRLACMLHPSLRPLSVNDKCKWRAQRQKLNEQRPRKLATISSRSSAGPAEAEAHVSGDDRRCCVTKYRSPTKTPDARDGESSSCNASSC